MEQPSPKRFWFRAKRYGWGWVPATWEGWMVLFGYLVLFTAGFVYFLRAMVTLDDNLVPKSIGFLIYSAVLVLILVVICYKKGEPPRWRWGGRE